MRKTFLMNLHHLEKNFMPHTVKTCAPESFKSSDKEYEKKWDEMNLWIKSGILTKFRILDFPELKDQSKEIEELISKFEHVSTEFEKSWKESSFDFNPLIEEATALFMKISQMFKDQSEEIRKS